MTDLIDAMVAAARAAAHAQAVEVLDLARMAHLSALRLSTSQYEIDLQGSAAAYEYAARCYLYAHELEQGVRA